MDNDNTDHDLRDEAKAKMLETLNEKRRKHLPRNIRMPAKLTGTRIISRRPKSPPRNKPCPCGSGRKYKKCCGAPERLQPKVKAVRKMPSPIAVPRERRAPGPDGAPLIMTPRDMDPLGHKDIVTPGEVEALVKRGLKDSEGRDKSDGIILVEK